MVTCAPCGDSGFIRADESDVNSPMRACPYCRGGSGGGGSGQDIGCVVLLFIVGLAATPFLFAIGSWARFALWNAPRARSLMERFDMTDMIATTEGGADGDPGGVLLRFGLMTLVAVGAVTVAKWRWHRGWVQSDNGQWNLRLGNWLFSVGRTLVLFMFGAFTFAATALAYGIEHQDSYGTAEAPTMVDIGLMAFLVLAASIPFVIFSGRRAMRAAAAMRPAEPVPVGAPPPPPPPPGSPPPPPPPPPSTAVG